MADASTAVMRGSHVNFLCCDLDVFWACVPVEVLPNCSCSAYSAYSSGLKYSPVIVSFKIIEEKKQLDWLLQLTI